MFNQKRRQSEKVAKWCQTEEMTKHKPSIVLSSHLCDLASIPPLIPPVIVPDLVRRIPSTVTTK